MHVSSAPREQVEADLEWWFGGITARMLDLQSRGRGFESRSGRHQMVILLG